MAKATFSVTPLVSGGYLVEGTDTKGVSGSVTLRSTAWDYVQHVRAHETADAAFEAEVDAFFKPLLKAAEAHSATVAGPSNEWGTVTIGETVEGKTARTIDLDSAGILLHILDETDGSTLRWVNGDLVAVL